jgi:hypothetical protein
MKIFALFAFVLCFIAIGMSSCKKYEDGPILSLRSKKERISNVWVIESATRNGVDVTNNYKDYILTMTKSGGATLQLKVDFFGTDVFLQTDGTWSLEELNNNLRLDFENNDFDRYYKITKLKEKELGLIEIGYNNDELNLKPM